MLFRQIVLNLHSAEQAKDEAKQRWLDLQRQSDDGQFDARREFLALSDGFAGQADGLVAELRRLSEGNLFELAVENLPADLRSAFYRVVAVLGIALPAQTRHATLSNLVTAWRNAAATLEAAQRLNQVRVGLEPACFEAELSDSASRRDPKAWEQAVEAYRLVLSEDEADGSLESRMGDATHAVVQYMRRLHDRLTEELREMLEGLVEANALADELAEMEPEVRRCVQEIAGSGFLRQRATAPQAETRTRRVTTLPKPAAE